MTLVFIFISVKPKNNDNLLKTKAIRDTKIDRTSFY